MEFRVALLAFVLLLRLPNTHTHLHSSLCCRERLPWLLLQTADFSVDELSQATRTAQIMWGGIITVTFRFYHATVFRQGALKHLRVRGHHCFCCHFLPPSWSLVGIQHL